MPPLPALLLLNPGPAPAQPFHAFLAGFLAALALLCALSHRPLKEPTLGLAGALGLLAALDWLVLSGLADTVAPPVLQPWLHPASLVLSALALVAWERLTFHLLGSSLSRSRLNAVRRGTALAALLIACLALIPARATHAASEALLDAAALLFVALTLVAGFRARAAGNPLAGSLLVATGALLVASLSMTAHTLGWIPRDLALALLQVALLGLTASLGWTMLIRMAALRLAHEAIQAEQLAQVGRQKEALETEVAARNRELHERLRDLEAARRSAEVANDGLNRALARLEQEASTDRLTGAWNRRRFEEAALSEIALAHRRREPLSLLMFDLDHFKRVNDTHGHAAGDLVLVGTAQTVRKYLRASDALVRWGGEEFLVMAPATRLEGAVGLAEKLRTALAAVDFPGIGSVTMSLGVSEYVVGEGLADWVQRTDEALYEAKAKGRNRSEAAPAPDLPASAALSQRSLLEVVWEDAYASGHQLIDRQHQRLFQLTSALLASLTAERPAAEIVSRLETLLAHAAQHFHDEEGLLRAARYPDLQAHTAIHASLLGRARQLQAEVQSGHLDFGRLITFLTLDLVKGHLLTEDQTYFEHLLAHDDPEAGPPAGA